jgi:hypothetical protein
LSKTTKWCLNPQRILDFFTRVLDSDVKHIKREIKEKKIDNSCRGHKHLFIFGPKRMEKSIIFKAIVENQLKNRPSM